MKKKNNIKLEQIEWNFNNLCPRIWVSKVYVQELR
jgi:hypothetical protein